MNTTQEKLLLYWSGELGPEDQAEVEALLARDTAAQEYLNELQALDEQMRDVPVPQHRSGLVTEVLSETREDSQTIISFPSSRSFLKSLIAAAAVILIGFVVFFSGPSSTPTEIAQKTVTPDQVPAEIIPAGNEAAPLSKRLFNSRSSFASSFEDRKERRQERQRLKKLQHSLSKI